MIYLASEGGAEATSNPLIPDVGEIVITLIGFLILYYIVAKYVVPAFEKIYQDRKEAIEGGLAKAEKAQAEAAAARDEYTQQQTRTHTRQGSLPMPQPGGFLRRLSLSQHTSADCGGQLNLVTALPHLRNFRRVRVSVIILILIFKLLNLSVKLLHAIGDGFLQVILTNLQVGLGDSIRVLRGTLSVGIAHLNVKHRSLRGVNHLS